MEKNEIKARVEAINGEVRSILDKAKEENRAVSEAETESIQSLRSEASDLMTEFRNISTNTVKMENNEAMRSAQMFGEQVAAALNGGDKNIAVRSNTTYSSAEPVVPVTIGDIIAPLEKGMILDKVGCKIQTGLKGDWKYPVVGYIEASVAGESAAISDSALTLSKVTATPHRVGLSVAVTNTALNGGDPELKNIVLTQVTEGLRRTLNKWMLQESAIASGVTGVFVAPGTSKTYTKGTTPTYAQIIALKGAVDATGVVADESAAYVMSNAMKATLEATPIATGDSRMVIENNMINGVPVYASEYVAAGYIKFGYFSYCLVGQFGDMNILVDPYTMSGSNQTRFVVNADFDIKAARAEAFGVLSEAA